jgi:hypothetical protein
MQKWIESRSEQLAAFFGRPLDTMWMTNKTLMPEISTEMEQHLGRLNFEWHIIPTNEAMPLDEAYYDRLYLMRPPYFSSGRTHSRSIRSMFESGHARHQGQIIAVETTMKPKYLPGNHQAYGTQYGFDSTGDPLREYLDHGTRYAHNYTSLRSLGERVNQDLRSRNLLPKGYRLTLCPPVVFNLIGNVFHPEWSKTESLELGFYRDDHGNATCYALGSNEPGDFSYVHEVETHAEWTHLGFRTALLPD